jgi:hypothetical protein
VSEVENSGTGTRVGAGEAAVGETDAGVCVETSTEGGVCIEVGRSAWGVGVALSPSRVPQPADINMVKVTRNLNVHPDGEEVIVFIGSGFLFPAIYGHRTGFDEIFFP